MEKRKPIRIITWIIGAIIIGAIGSGVWKHILEPSVFKGRDIILNITILGVEKFKDNIYREVSNGFHEASSLELYFLFLLIIINVLIMMGISSVFIARRLKQEHSELMATIKHAQEGKEREKPTLDALYDKASTIKTKRLVTASLLLAFLLIALSTVLCFDYARARYINSAVTYFHKMRTIVKPYLEREQEKLILSKFARISNKQEYIAVLSELKQIADTNKLVAPDFDVW